MDKQAFVAAVKKLRESPKKKFSQSVDLIINLQQLDLKNPAHKVDVAANLPAGVGKKMKICGLVDKELGDKSKQVFDHTILKDQFSSLSVKDIKKLAEDYDYFVAQATLMVEIAKYFGKSLGPKSKMPNPKMGCVIPPNANLEQVRDRLNKIVRLQIKKEPIIKALVGKDSLTDEQIAENAFTAYETVLHALPNEKSNVHSVYLKFTMTPAVKIGGVA